MRFFGIPRMVPLRYTFSLQLLVKPGADLQERRHPPAHGDRAGCWAGDAREHLQQGALAGAVAPDDADHLASLDGKRDVPESPDRLLVNFCGSGERGPEQVHEDLAEHRGSLGPAQPELLSHSLHGDGGRHVMMIPQTMSEK
jgi:hypothetical protein